tara:strand:+ start:556 stop:1068 length:513 start_codon:yes stop_codon:yes gene_type:complete
MKKILLILLSTIGLQTQAQQSIPMYFCCDSITYNIDPSQGFNIYLDTTNIVHNPDSIEVLWSICNSSACYTADGMFAYFGQIITTDTVKACYDVYLYESGTVEVCTRCDSLIFNGTSWVLFSTGNPTAINNINQIDDQDGQIYDLMGRKLTEIPIGVIYIRNNKKHIKYK